MSLPLSRMAQAAGAIVQKRPALLFTAAILAVQAWFMRGMPLTGMLVLLLPAGILIFLASSAIVLLFQKRFNRAASRLPEIGAALALTVGTGLLFDFSPALWLLAFVTLVWLVVLALSGSTGPLWTVLAGLCVGALVLFAHIIITIESRLLARLSQPETSRSFHTEQQGNEMKLLEDGKERLLIRAPAGMHSMAPSEIAQLGIHSPGRPIAGFSRDSREPYFILFEIAADEKGNSTAAYLAQLQFSGGIENLTGPAVDRLEIPGYALRGLVWDFKSAGGAPMRLSIYCAATFDVGIAIFENARPGFPHEPLILDVLSGFWPGSQKGRSGCAL